MQQQRSERTIRTLAKELAGEFFEQKRSDRFRSKGSLTRAKVLRQLPDGTVFEDTVVVPFFQAYPNARAFAKGHWPLFYDVARKCLVAMLAMPDARISPYLKESIYAALIEDRQKQNDQPGVQSLIQARLGT